MIVDALPQTAVRPTKPGLITPPRTTVLLLALIAIATQSYYWAAYGRRWTDTDQTVLWTTAQDLSHGRIHQFNFYGQTYATGWETLPAAFLLRSGESPTSAVPLATTLLATMVFVLLASAAARNRRWWLAAALLAIVPLASARYLILLDAPRGVMGGLFLGTLAVSIWFGWRNSAKATACLFALGPLAILFDLGTALVVGPVLVVAAVTAWRRRWWLTYAFLLVPTGYAVASHVYYSEHPEQDRFHPLPFQPDTHFLTTTLQYLPDYFRLFNLGPIPGVWLALSAFWLLAFFILLRRSWEGGLALGTLVLLLLLMLSSPKSQDAVGGVYLSPSRIFLGLPMACCVVALLTPAARAPAPGAGRSAWRSVGAGMALVAVTAAAFGHVISTMPAVTRRATALSTTNYILEVGRSTRLVADCSRDVRRAKALGADAIAYDGTSKHAYGCQALHPDIPTFDVPYERRSWRIDDLHQTYRRVLVIGAPSICPSLPAGSRTVCAPAENGAALLTGSKATLSEMLRTVDLAVLPFDSTTVPASCMRLHSC